MKNQWLTKVSFTLTLTLTVLLVGRFFHTVEAKPLLAINTKTLTPNKAIASWQTGIPIGEKRPVVVFLPGWGGVGGVNASISPQNTNVADQGYVTLAIGFDSSQTWISDINQKTLEGLNKLCVDATIPANCSAIVLNGSSYGGAQNYWVIEYVRSNGYDGSIGSKGNVIGFVSQDAGYGAPGNLVNANTGEYNRTSLADTSAYSIAMIENLGDTTFPVDECTWGNCGIRALSNAHFVRGDTNVFSICPPGGEHGTRGYTDWNTWVISAIKTIIHIVNAVPAFTGYSAPALSVTNSCVTSTLPGLSISGTQLMANGQVVRLRGINMGDPFWARGWYGSMYSTANYATLAQDWHANVVRISIFPTQWKNMNRTTLLEGLDTEIQAALSNGMYVIISYHVIGWPDGWYQPAYPGNPADTYDSSLSVATSFWTQMAQTYGSDTRIIFDLWNEPVHDSSDWSNVTYWTSLKPSYESLIQTVRNNGAQNIVLATGSGWASWLAGIKDSPLADTKVMYAYHKYSVEGNNTEAVWNTDLGGLLGVKPVIVSEWGYEDSDVTNPTWPGTQTSYGDPFTQWLDSNNLSNLTWMYHHDWTPALIKSDSTPTLYGTFIKGYFTNLSIGTTKPDLIVTSVTVNPAAPKNDQTFTVNITVKNQGASTGANTIYRDVYIDRDPSTLLDPITGCPPPGDFFISNDYANIPAGMTDTKTVTVTGGLPAGDHQIWVYVDSRCLIDEGTNSNNSP